MAIVRIIILAADSSFAHAGILEPPGVIGPVDRSGRKGEGALDDFFLGNIEKLPIGSEKNISSHKSSPFVSVKKWMILHDPGRIRCCQLK